MFEEPKKAPRLENPHDLFGKVGAMKWEDVVIPVKYISRKELQNLLLDSSSLDSPSD